MLKPILPFKGVNNLIEGINEIKYIKFKKVILMLSSSIFFDFIPQFKEEKSKICCCLNVIVFTQKTN